MTTETRTYSGYFSNGSDSIGTVTGYARQTIGNPVKIMCPVHGEIHVTMQSAHPDDKEIYCTRCIFDKMKELGISTVTRVEDERPTSL